jgi:methionyl-tRNA formyltransferase
VSDVAVTLFEAEATVDSGDIYAQQWLHFHGTELVSELRAAQSAATISLCKDFVRDYPRSATFGRPQVGEETKYRRRTPADSALDPDQCLAEQFDLLRIVDSERYPATLQIRGASYRFSIERVTD